MSLSSDCFIVLPPNCAENTIIVGRNAGSGNLQEAQEVIFYEAAEATAGKADGGAAPNLTDDRFRLILQKPQPGVWGADYGANEANVCIGVIWTSGACENECLLATDVVRYTLASSKSASAAIETCGTLAAAHGNESIKSSLLICDPKEAWLFSCAGNLWAAQQLKDGFQRLSSDGLAVTTLIDKSSDGLEDALKMLGAWNGEAPLNFAACFDAEPTSTAWSGPEPTEDASYSLISMFETLRSAADASSRAANVSVLNSCGITCHWFTGTPNASESVFKPFIFAPNPKISPLTKVLADNELTLLHQLHSQRKPAAILDLKQLEASCVEEVSTYLAEHPTADAELDELLKDCVEAEVKFYR